MSSEANLWKWLRDGMGSRWHAQRHEDKYSSGIPDVSYAIDGADGWLELKYLPAWPKRQETPVKIGLSEIQRHWLTCRGRAGAGRCFVLAKIGRGDVLLFRWDALPLLGDLRAGCPRFILTSGADRHWAGTEVGRPIFFDSLAYALRQTGKKP